MYRLTNQVPDLLVHSMSNQVLGLHEWFYVHCLTTSVAQALEQLRYRHDTRPFLFCETKFSSLPFGIAQFIFYFLFFIYYYYYFFCIAHSMIYIALPYSKVYQYSAYNLPLLLQHLQQVRS